MSDHLWNERRHSSVLALISLRKLAGSSTLKPGIALRNREPSSDSSSARSSMSLSRVTINDAPAARARLRYGWSFGSRSNVINAGTGVTKLAASVTLIRNPLATADVSFGIFFWTLTLLRTSRTSVSMSAETTRENSPCSAISRHAKAGPPLLAAACRYMLQSNMTRCNGRLVASLTVSALPSDPGTPLHGPGRSTPQALLPTEDAVWTPRARGRGSPGMCRRPRRGRPGG